MRYPLSPHRSRRIMVPASIVFQSYLPPTAKSLYAAMIAYAHPGNHTDNGSFVISQAKLAEILGIGSKVTVRSLTRILSQAGWLSISRNTRTRTYSYVPLDPHLAIREAVLRRVNVRLERERHKGEALMKEMLNALIDDDRFQDNARPGFLVNPLTEERLEFDRWYTEANVAFEFNGPQHDKPTAVYPDLDDVRNQRARDLMKAAIAGKRGIRLLAVYPANLRFEWFVEQLAGLLPIRELRLDDPVVRALDTYSRAYVRRSMGA